MMVHVFDHDQLYFHLDTPTASLQHDSQQDRKNNNAASSSAIDNWNHQIPRGGLCPLENVTSTSKLLRHNQDGQPSKVLLYPEEGWAQTATNAYWLISVPWWNRHKCKVVEVAGTRRSTGRAKLVEGGSGTIYLIGSFKSGPEPDFKLSLTSHVSRADFNQGYRMTGTLERGYAAKGNLQLTHFAVLRRYE